MEAVSKIYNHRYSYDFLKMYAQFQDPLIILLSVDNGICRKGRISHVLRPMKAAGALFRSQNAFRTMSTPNHSVE